MSKKLRTEVNEDPDYLICSLRDYDPVESPCAGRITREHAIIYAGRKVQEKWAIIPLCARHHAVDEYQDGGDMKKEVSQWVALNRASDAILTQFSKAVDYIRLRGYLNDKYGVWVKPVPKKNLLPAGASPK